jgi:ribosomal protein L12E/L44/L45/RPP1/RPP2
MRLWLAGEIEPDSEKGWQAALARDFRNVGWWIVEDPVAQEEVASRASARTPRNATKSAEEKAKEIVDALSDRVVNEMVQEMLKEGAASTKAQKRAKQALRKKASERRQKARQAERDRTADAEFKRVLKQLWDARGAVAAVDQHLIEERARVAAGEPRRIVDWSWIVALRDVREIITSLGGIWQNVRDLADTHEPCPACGASTQPEERHLQPFVIDAEAVEVAEDSIDSDDGIVDAEVII